MSPYRVLHPLRPGLTLLGAMQLSHLLTACMLASIASVAWTKRLAPPMDAYKHPSGSHMQSVEAADMALVTRCKELYRNATLDHFSWV